MAKNYVVEEWQAFIADKDVSEFAGIMEEDAAEELLAAKDSIRNMWQNALNII